MTSTISSIIHELDINDEKQLRLFYDDILNKTSEDEYQYLIEIINTLIEANLPCVHIVDHLFFIHIRNTFIDYSQKSIDNFRLPYLISQLFLQLIDHVNDKNLHIAQQFFADVNLIDCLIESLKNVTSISDENFVGTIEHMIDAYQTLQQDRIPVQNDPILLSMMMPIVDVVKSSEYINTFLQLSPHQNEFTHYQKFLLVTCQKYVSSHWGEYYDEVTSAIVQQILSRSSDILKYALPTIDDWQAPMIWSVFSLILICQYCANQRLLRAYDIYHKQILDCILEIVQGKELYELACEKTASNTSDMRQKRASQLFCYATLYIYTMTFLPELRDKLKANNAVAILLKLTEANFDKTQFHAYRALAAILTDNDIRQLANPTQITTVFITYLKKSIDVLQLKQRLENLLLSLKILIQHDLIKEDFARQTDGIHLLFRCASEVQFNSTKIQLRSLKILMSLTFNNEAKLIIEKSEHFVNYLRTLVSSTNSPDIQKIADGILWRLFPKDEQTETTFQYDVMISYSHKDKTLCHQIHKTLVADNFRVWIDLERMHGIMLEAMADAVEQSRYVILCMSDNYCISPYCRAEAQFAFEKQRGLIPIRLQNNYKPQGWLAFIISGRMYVDFIKFNFDVAYSQLKSEFQQNQIHEHRASTVVSRSNIIEQTVVKKEQPTVYSYPKDIFEWTSSNVHDFLLDKQLDQMIPVCQQMDGQKLVEVYKLCRLNSPVMLQTMRSETMESHSTTLKTNIYLTFLYELKKIIPENTIENVSSRSQVCTLL